MAVLGAAAVVLLELACRGAASLLPLEVLSDADPAGLLGDALHAILRLTLRGVRGMGLQTGIGSGCTPEA
jgi:hypothetical protein